MNGAPLPVAHGQLGYKVAKYVMRIEAVDGIAAIRGGPWRLLGRSRLRMVRWHLKERQKGPWVPPELGLSPACDGLNYFTQLSYCAAILPFAPRHDELPQKC